MSKPLHALIVEDSEDDTQLLVMELKRGGYDPIYRRVETPEDMAAVLSAHSWDIVFADFTMPRFNAFDALALLHKSGLDLPFLIVSGTIGEDRAVAAMKAGAHDYILKNNLKRLLPAVERELREAQNRRERRRAEETARYLAHTDPVTDLPNRIRFRELVQEAVASAQSQQRPMALMLLDLNRFRDVNETLGHTHGDNLLRQVGLRLQSVLFAPDVVARLGGNEFGILLPKLASTEDIPLIVQKLKDFLQPPFLIEGIPIAVETSIGVALLPIHADDADGLLQRADIALRHAKKMGQDFAVYTHEYDHPRPERLRLMAELRDAIASGQLILHFQPKLAIQRARICGMEALVRWQHPQRGLLGPDLFVSTAEHTGLVHPLTEWVLHAALRALKEIRPVGLSVSVNLSARSLHDPRLPNLVEHALAISGTPPERLTLEITESAIVLDPKRALEHLTALSRMGVALSIDDFGTGYTSLAHIKRLPLREIKIDKSFVAGLPTNHRDAMIVRSIIELGHNLGLTVVAEGVETQEILASLAQLGCDEAQGYLISRPQDSRSLQSWLEASPWNPRPPSES